MAKSNNSNLVITVIITCLLSTGIATGILFATKPWCGKGDNNKPSHDLSLGRQQDFAPDECGIGNLNKNTPDCLNVCKKQMDLKCPNYSQTYCSDQCDTGGPPPAGSGDGYNFGNVCGEKLTSHTNVEDCNNVATNCCTLKCKGNTNCIQTCITQAVQGHCMYRGRTDPDGPSPPSGGGGGSPPPSGGGGGSPPPSPLPFGGNNVESGKPFYEQPVGIGLIVFCVLVVMGGIAWFVMRKKKSKR
jgi:hypothetical protein